MLWLRMRRLKLSRLRPANDSFQQVNGMKGDAFFREASPFVMLRTRDLDDRQDRLISW